jgi:riboflavin kinase/FMN adenylyltransferase
MERFDQINDFTSTKGTVLTIGTFDGVHIGHQKIIEQVVQIATKEHLYSCLLTFSPHPREVLQKDTNIKMLTTQEEKADRLQSLGLQSMVVHPFSKEFSRLTAREYVEDVLVSKLKVKHLIVGYDHRFGRNREADIVDLNYFAKRFDFKVTEIEAQDIDDVAVSSTKIRNALSEGVVHKANQYLGYHYGISGTVSKGMGLGKTLGFPTANLEQIDPKKLLPANGVYIISAILDGKLVKGMMNIGINPTINQGGLHAEVHLLDFDSDLYNRRIRVSFHKRLRSEKRFESLEALSAQLKEDKSMTLKYFKEGLLS